MQSTHPALSSGPSPVELLFRRSIQATKKDASPKRLELCSIFDGVTKSFRARHRLAPEGREVPHGGLKQAREVASDLIGPYLGTKLG